MINNRQKEHFSTAEVGKILRISRVAVLKKINAGHIKAQKVGRNYIIAQEDLDIARGKTVSATQKNQIERAVQHRSERRVSRTPSY